MSITGKSSELLKPTLQFRCNGERKPLCLPPNSVQFRPLPAVFAGDSVELVANVSFWSGSVTFLWIFLHGEHFTTWTNSTSTNANAFGKNVHAIRIAVSSSTFAFNDTFKLVAVKKEVGVTYDSTPALETEEIKYFPILGINLIDECWNFELHCPFSTIPAPAVTLTEYVQPCDAVSMNLIVRFDEPGKYQCHIKSSGRLETPHLGNITFEVYPPLESVRVTTESVVATKTPTLLKADVSPQCKDWNYFAIHWRVFGENGVVIVDIEDASPTLNYEFRSPGVYAITVTASTQFSQVRDSTSVLVQDPVGDVLILSPGPVQHVRVHSDVRFLARPVVGTDVQCLWKLQCLYPSPTKPFSHERDINSCDCWHRFQHPASCSLSLAVFNGISRMQLRDRFEIHVEEPVSVLEFGVPAELESNSRAEVFVALKNGRQNVLVDVSVDSTSQEVVYDPRTLTYNSTFVPLGPGIRWARLWARNNVSSVILRKPMFVVEEVGEVDIVNVGCRAVGHPLRFLVFINGTVPRMDGSYLYYWHLETELDRQIFYTSVPMAESKRMASPWNMKVSVKVSNGVSSRSASTSAQVWDVPLDPCLLHDTVIRRGQFANINVLGLPPGRQSGNLTLRIKHGQLPASRVTEVNKNFINSSDIIRWRYLPQSSGFHSVMGLLFLERSDSSCEPCAVQTGFLVAQRLHSLRIFGPRTVYLSRFPVSLTWRAGVKPVCSGGCVFRWTLHGCSYVTPIPQLTVTSRFPAGSYRLGLKAWNAFGSLESSMVFEIATTLLLLNYTLSNFFVLQNGSISLEINQASPPDTVFVDFGDDTVYDSSQSSHPGLLFLHSRLAPNESSVLTLHHTYGYAGMYDVYVNVTNSVSGFDQWMSVMVEEKIAGVRLVLLTSPVVELLEEVAVTCWVDRGSNLRFKWDFGDGTDGEQYTRQQTFQVDGFKTNNTAHHSYGIANSYPISVHISNTYESVTVYLNATIKAVERIVELNLHPRIRGRFAAPLYRKKNNDGTDASAYTTSPIEFETGLWRGSDVQFLFDFGDGNLKRVSSLLNAWSLPYAIVKHSYASEGRYDVSVTATNLLSSVNASLERPFYVQFLPENLLLDKLYYIIEHGDNITLHTSLSQGTNVSYIWKVGDMHITDAGSSLFLPFLNPGIYAVTVEAFNQVTDYGYSVVRRPNATAKIYVQEKLLGIEICVKVNAGEFCNPGILDFPLDEEVEFRARVVPSTETVLRFIWQLGIQEIRRTNVPFFIHKYQQAGWYSINVTAQNHISSISSISLQLNLVQKVANLTSIFCQGPNLVNHPITYRAFYWFGTNLTFQWDFGDGSNLVTTTSSSVQHTYKEVGEYWVTLNVWNKFSHSNITTSMFFLHHMCQKPEIAFLHQRTRIARYDMDVLIEADVSVVCKTTSVEYQWTVEKAGSNVVELGSSDALNRRQLVIPRNILEPGSYNVRLKVNMVNTIVYAESSTYLEVVLPYPLIYVEGGFMRWAGIHDTRKLTAKSAAVKLENQTQLNYIWSCTPQLQKHLPCFKSPDLLHSNHSSELIFPISSITPHLASIIINVTLESSRLLSASQVLEINQVPHMLDVNIECEECLDHHVNQHNKLKIKAICNHCDSGTLVYHWKVWIIEDGKFRLHFGNYECVQADGSTFFIVAPNSTQDKNVLNTTFLPNDDGRTSVKNASDDHMLAEKPYEAAAEDLPPFPNLPGFPEENNTTQGGKLSRNTRNTLDEELYESPDLIPPPEYPYEGDADYDYNSTFEDFPYPDFMPLPVPDMSMEDPNYLLTEEGLPGESGSAAPRKLGSQNLGIMLSEDEDQILEEAGKPRMKEGSNNVLVHKPNERGDPLRDGLGRKFPAPHIVNKARSLLTLSKNATTTGFNSEYLILKPGILKVGRAYLIQAQISNTENGQEGFAMEYFKVNVGPINGRCTLMPVEGYSIDFDFRMHCLEWKSDHLPLYYELSYSRNVEDVGHLIYFGLNENVKFNLPSGFISDSYNVYLNVIVRDNKGVPTKVCSIIRKVKPALANITIEHIVYNETFHPKSSLKKLVGEKNNQAILQKLHVLASSLNSQHPISSNLESDPEILATRSKIRQGFFEIINDLRISSKVETTQLISVLNEIIADVQTIKLFELQKAYNIYKKMHGLQSKLYNFFASDQMHQEFMIFLSKLAFAAHTIHPRNDELVEISREEVIKEMKDLLKSRLNVEDPLKVDICHLSASAFYLNDMELHLKPSILLKQSAVQLLDNSHLVSRFRKEPGQNCPHDGCLVLVIQEYDYITSSPTPNTPDFLEASKSSILLSLTSFDNLEDKDLHPLNVSAHFSRRSEVLDTRNVTLKNNYMNVHVLNITENHIHHSLLFHIRLDTKNLTEENTAIDIMFRHSSHPTLTTYDLKKSFSAGTSEIDIIISPDKIRVPGLYYISVLSSTFLERNPAKEVIWEYEASLWKDVCLGKVAGYWSTNNCYVMDTTNHNCTHCKCAVHEITSFSVPLTWDLYLVPVNDLIDPYFNPVPLLALLGMSFLYFMMVYLNFKRDKVRHLTCSPIPLRDNNAKHRQKYLICLKTGFYFSSGTTASVFIVLHGTKDVTETRQLIGKDTKKFCFQKGSVDIFLLSTERSLGPLLKLEVWHDNEGFSPSWFLKSISIKDLRTGGSYFFNCFSWLSADSGDGQIEKEFTVAENPPLFVHVFYDNLIAYISDFNMWNALVCDSPVSYFTGVQRITCCFCFILNCACLLSLFTDLSEEMEDNLLPHVTLTTFLASIVAALISSIPQIFFTILFRFSKHPSVEMNPKFVDLFHWLSPYSFNCWLRHKLSTSGPSTDRSSSGAGSDSLYSSFGDSSIISVPDVMEESFSIEGEEKDVLPLSFSFPDLSDPVSPLQKTLSTWQTLENWLKKKHDLILKPDVMVMKRNSCSSSIELDERFSDQGNVEDDSSQTWQQSATVSRNSNSEDIVSELHQDIHFVDKELDLNFFFPCLNRVFYYFGWFILLTDLIGMSVFILSKTARFSIPYSILFLKNVIISVVFSCLLITPLIIVLFSAFVSIHFLIVKSKFKLPDIIETSEKQKRTSKTASHASSYKRMEYFKKYLRPPKEEVLEPFRQASIQQKRICNFCSDLWNFVVILVLLVSVTYPEDTNVKYLQRSSIEKALFRSMSKATKTVPTKYSLLSWLETDFLDGFLTDHQCSNEDKGCSMSTKCIMVGSVILRHFYFPKCTTLGSDCSFLHGMSVKYDSVYERRSLRGYHGSYYAEDDWHVLSEQIFQSYDEVHDFVEKLNASSAATLEFLLFNPTFSTFISVSFLFEVTSVGAVAITSEILPVVVPGNNSFSLYLKIFFNLIFFIFILFTSKTHLWKTMKHRCRYWKQLWNYLSCMFVSVYFIYLVFFVMYVIGCEKVSFRLMETQLSSNVDITELAMLEKSVYSLVGCLMFLHVLSAFKVLSFSRRLKNMLKRLSNSQKNISVAVLVFFIIVLSSIVMVQYFVGMSPSFSHPLFGFIKVITSLFKDYEKPEVTEVITPFRQFMSIFTSMILICVHIYLFSIIRSVLLYCESINVSFQTKNIDFKTTSEIIQNKFQTYFKPGNPKTVSQIDYVPPMEFLLFELERLADELVTKANALFPEKNDMENFLKQKCKLQLDKTKFDLEEFVTSALEDNNSQLEDCNSHDRLISTIPRRSKGNLNSFMPPSFHASLGSEKKYKTLETSEVSLQNRIRKTYPLSHLDSDSSSSGTTSSQADEKLDSVSSLLLRRTKSRGKGKDENFDLDIETSDHDLK